MDDIARKYGLTSQYLNRKRVSSYADQISALLELRPANVLEIGKGPGLVSGALRAVGVDVLTLDLRPQLSPDLVRSVTRIPVKALSFDVALCCQVLEHLPFAQFPLACRELRRVTRHALVLSLPDITKHYYVRFRLPYFKQRACSWSIPRLSPPQQRTGPEVQGHYWEIGFRGASLARVRTELQASGWELERTWRVPENVWHRFFLLKAGTPQQKAAACCS